MYRRRRHRKDPVPLRELHRSKEMSYQAGTGCMSCPQGAGAEEVSSQAQVKQGHYPSEAVDSCVSPGTGVG